MSDVIDLANKRKPVFYTIQVQHNWDGTVELAIDGLENTKRSNRAVARALRQAARLADETADSQTDDPAND